jgi:hypothetical protein
MAATGREVAGAYPAKRGSMQASERMKATAVRRAGVQSEASASGAKSLRATELSGQGERAESSVQSTCRGEESEARRRIV